MYAYPRNHQCPSPINNLPIELLSYIFSLSTYPNNSGFSGSAEEEYRPPTITTESVQVPLVLSSVSRLWRQVALGTPHLWSSLCITVELVENFYSNERDPRSGFTKSSRQLNTSHITSYLALSRKYPLNILIDARDENWNFEPELVSDHGEESYTPAFTSKHMNIVFTLLLPHLSRWKSLSILTDCWAPMYTALTAINPFITRFGAPFLESLSLMRCNDLISFSPLFQPQQLKEPEFLNRGNNTNQTHPHHHSDVERCPKNMIPSLKYLSLRGVHVDWDALGDSLSTSETGLTSLELASHSHDVRPSPEQFYKILCSSSGLRNLVLSASGPSIIPEDTVFSSSSSSVHDDYVPAHLPYLRNITIGYRTAMEGRIALGLIDAPNTKELVLEDATYVGDPDVINAGPLLSYIGTRQFGEAHQNHRITASSELTAATLGNQAARLVVAEKPVRRVSCVHVNEDATESRSAAAFPLLESVTLRGVKTCSQPLRAFLGSLPNLQHLELTRMSMQAIHALLPSVVLQIPTTATTTATATTNPDDCYTTNLDCPCPQLRSLCIRSFEQLDSRDVDFIIGSLPVERQTKGGACQLREVDIHVDAATATSSCVVVPLSHFETTSSSPTSMKVNIINDVSSDEDDESRYGDWDGDDDYDYDYDYDYEDGRDTSMGLEDPYEPGGAFNDPLFDEYYSLHFQTVR